MPTPRSLSTAPNQDLDLQLVHGTWPETIHGEVLYSGPRVSGKSPAAIFDFGGLTRLSLRPGTYGAPADRFAFRTRPIQTPSKRLFDRAPELFTGALNGYMSPFGSSNAANTAPLPWGDRLFVTWDAGRPVELNPDTFEFLAEVGTVDSWGGPSLPGTNLLPLVLSSAHPVIDPERNCLWTAKLDLNLAPSFSITPCVVRWEPDSTEVKQWPLEGITFNGSVHTVTQTRDWVILGDSGNFRVDIDEMMGAERTVTVDGEAPLWLIRKDVLERTPPGTPVRPVPLMIAPPGGHYYAQYDDTDGISIVWEAMDLTDLAFPHRLGDNDVNGNPMDPCMASLYNMALAPDTLKEIRIDPNTGKVIDRGYYRTDDSFNLQLSAMDWTLEGLENPTLHHVIFQGARPGSVSQRSAALYEGRFDPKLLAEETPGRLMSFRRGTLECTATWDYPNTNELISSPTFAPRPDDTPGASRWASGAPGGHDGWVVLPVLSDDGFRVDVFEADNVGAGPVAVLMGPNREQVPLKLHSAWMPSATGGVVDVERLNFRSEMTDEAMASVPEEHRALVVDMAETLP